MIEIFSDLERDEPTDNTPIEDILSYNQEMTYPSPIPSDQQVTGFEYPDYPSDVMLQQLYLNENLSYQNQLNENFNYDSNNIGYYFDQNTGNYIPVTVTVDSNVVYPDVNGQEMNVTVDSNTVDSNVVYPDVNGQEMNVNESKLMINMPQKRKNDHLVDDNTRPRKRMKKGHVALPTPDKLMNIKENEDSLIGLDSQTFDEYVSNAYMYRKYSDEEKEYFRDIRRKIKK